MVYVMRYRADISHKLPISTAAPHRLPHSPQAKAIPGRILLNQGIAKGRSAARRCAPIDHLFPRHARRECSRFLFLIRCWRSARRTLQNGSRGFTRVMTSSQDGQGGRTRTANIRPPKPGLYRLSYALRIASPDRTNRAARKSSENARRALPGRAWSESASDARQ